MKYWYDTEFIEDGKTIDLISIAVVAEDGRELYMESADCDLTKASAWVQQNVMPYLTGPTYSRKVIADALRDFCSQDRYGEAELWGYYADYDHVALCQLFGTMTGLPPGWPMYTLDIRQWADALGSPRLPQQKEGAHQALADARWHKEMWEFLADFRHRTGR